MEHAAGNILNNIMETIADGVQQHNPEIEEQNTASARVRKLFGRQKTIHKILGGGQSADVLLWRNKKISSSVLTCATVIWVLFEWLNYHFLTLLAFALFLGMLIQFAWSSASVVLNRSTSQVPRLVIPDDLFANVAVSLGAQINQFLGFIQDVACERNLKQFLVSFMSGCSKLVGCCYYRDVVQSPHCCLCRICLRSYAANSV
ncbi:reticulon-like protein B8 isoform X2 [Musa acuminata AAA Group]|uniref:reticulon-like protein B8 isoform X2 n=1 Tax=Musa acuminata AAA Group TaxID=214697 RepID=UPI0031DAA31E